MGRPKGSKNKANGAAKVTAAKNPRQQTLAGMEDPTIDEIDSAAEAYVDAREERMAQTEIEKGAHDNLVAVMQKHGRTTYTYTNGNLDKLKVVLSPGHAKVSVRKKKTDQAVMESAPVGEPEGEEATE